jgi:hypothetical protein
LEMERDDRQAGGDDQFAGMVEAIRRAADVVSRPEGQEAIAAIMDAAKAVNAVQDAVKAVAIQDAVKAVAIQDAVKAVAIQDAVKAVAIQDAVKAVAIQDAVKAVAGGDGSTDPAATIRAIVADEVAKAVAEIRRAAEHAEGS